MAYYAPFYRSPYYNPMQADATNQYNQQIPQPMMSQQGNSGLLWVQGEGGAKSFPVVPNTTVMLMDSEAKKFYLKSADASGVPLPLRTFLYEEQTDAFQTNSNAPIFASDKSAEEFITRKEFEEKMALMASQFKCRKKASDSEKEVEGNV